jgi:signal transduction histidine kinase
VAPSDTSFPRLVSLAAHDLRTPLATINGFAQTLLRMGDLQEPNDRYMTMIVEAARQLAELLDELGLAARIEGDRYEPNLQVIDTLELARAAQEELGEERVRVYGDGGQVQVDVEAGGTTVTIRPVTEASGPVLMGDDLRDLGAAVAVRVVAAMGGAVALDGDAVVVRLST